MVCCSFFGLRPKLRIKQDQNRRQFYGHASSSSAIPGGALLVSETPHQTQVFTYRELATATNNFRRESLIGRGGFGAVYKGVLESTGQTVAVKVHDKTGLQGDKEFLVEVLMLSLVSHQHLVKLIGYCAEGDQRIVVYEHMPLGSVEDHLHSGQEVLDWNTRMQIAAGAAKGLEHLHNVATPHVIYRDLKTANILLDHGYKPKLSDFGLAKFGPSGDRSHASTKVMGTLGYCAPEYADSGKLTDKSDIFSFGVVLLELVTGRKALIDSLVGPRRYLVTWARQLYTDENIKNIVDPKLSIRNQYMEATVKNAVKVAFMCLREDATKRPSISEVVNALDYIAKCTSNIRKRSNSGSKNVNSSKGISSIQDNKEKIEEINREEAIAEAKTWAKNVTRQEKEPPSPST